MWCVAFSPDGKTLTSRSHDKTIKVWDLKTSKERATLEGHADVVQSVAYSQDSKTRVAAGFDKTIKRWGGTCGLPREEKRKRTPVREGIHSILWDLTSPSRARTRRSGLLEEEAVFVKDMLCDWIKTDRGRPPSWEEIEAAIRQLDGKKKTEVSIAGEGEAHMSISGGNGIYLVDATPNNDLFYSLRNPEGPSEEEVQVVSGGQLDTVSLAEVVPLEMTLIAARTFAENGEFD